MNLDRPCPSNYLLPTLLVPPPALSTLQIWSRPRQPQLTVKLILVWEDISCVWFHKGTITVDLFQCFVLVLFCFFVMHFQNRTISAAFCPLKKLNSVFRCGTWLLHQLHLIFSPTPAVLHQKASTTSPRSLPRHWSCTLRSWGPWASTPLTWAGVHIQTHSYFLTL